METICANGNTVESWYDRKSRNHVTMVKDRDGNQIGDADYSGCKPSRDSYHASAVSKNGGKRKVIKLSGNMITMRVVDGECEVDS